MKKTLFKPIQVHPPTFGRWNAIKPKGITNDAFCRLVLDVWQGCAVKGISLDELIRREK